MIRNRKTILQGFIVLAFLLSSGCQRNDNASQERTIKRAVVSDDGKQIQFSPDHPGLQSIGVQQVKKGWGDISAIAPARVVACISAGMSSSDRIVLFESADVTSLYSQYRQSKSNMLRASNNLTRIKDMFANQTATTKDLSEAENDATNAKASMAEYEGRLRAVGFNPTELEVVESNTAWLISDVPETQLREVQNGEEVDVFFSAYPDKKFAGHVASIGEVIDPITRTVKVRVTIPNPKGRFMPGMFAKIEYGDPIPSVIVLPTAAIVSVDGKDYVFVQTSTGQFQRRQITLRNTSTNNVVVSQGLDDSDNVVIKGTMLLKGLSFGY